ncbi:protocatechuate 3,4-dioxygenase [Caldimonas sp. KR1-144]|uniref:protocatechuate 3,4-dioxygenase n=1 Tax=Caldimonas sp. KR1-144 TaxID=3400911 RepID=UPI003C06530B
MSNITTSQTIGPFPHEAWAWGVEATKAPANAALVIEGRLLDGSGAPINDGWVEAWTPDEAGGAIPGFRRVPSAEDGGFRLALPPPVPGQPAAWVAVFARGLLLHQFSAVFLEDDAALADSALLAQVPAERRATLIAKKQGDGRYRWDIRLQGAADASGETVFFDFA